MTTPTWLAADWGTSNMRLWAMGACGAVLGERTSDKGMGDLNPNAFEGVLIDVAGDWLTSARTVVACGMVGSRQGWVEAPYQTAPCAVSPDTMVQAPTTHEDLIVHIIPGVRQTNPADVMRGEETQIAGFLAQNDGWDGVLCLPGTHTKWVHVSAGEIVSFRTFMTGEMFALLSGHSVLRHSIADCGWNEDTFLTALSDAMSKPEALAARLFSIRAGQLVAGTDTVTARAHLSGLLIGAELAAAKPYWLGQRVAIIGADAVCAPYVSGLTAQGVPAPRADATTMTLAGIKAAHALLKG
ncbi:2-dehydro-3-deoxygalactonokinase [Pseudooctadecabacter jejudonensis]|uniref:2-keto-3-deoxy-galactonokinase n=1 Tax=Pseudooctadecabacter jejudonensis TaxID=1391910 RepID=A0A1Y5T4D1_9RHOB|nr:2-dehydro-3-deoxygalactonokinase [Pseudooctadecabacter jejudonensis]SLN55098.1 2-keto-3-deoxy-galactonokinase [Pseudooctadecabacter jejudonensis]